MPEMKPCPFCSGKNLQVSMSARDDLYAIYCSDCGARGPQVQPKTGFSLKAWKMWNERPWH